MQLLCGGELDLVELGLVELDLVELDLGELDLGELDLVVWARYRSHVTRRRHCKTASNLKTERRFQ